VVLCFANLPASVFVSLHTLLNLIVPLVSSVVNFHNLGDPLNFRLSLNFGLPKISLNSLLLLDFGLPQIQILSLN